MSIKTKLHLRSRQGMRRSASNGARKLHHHLQKAKTQTLLIIAAFLWGAVICGGILYNIFLTRSVIENKNCKEVVSGNSSYSELSQETQKTQGTQNVKETQGTQKYERLNISIPENGDMVGDVFEIDGLAWGWFEGTIPIRVYDDNNVLLYEQSFLLEDENYEEPARFFHNVVLNGVPTTERGRVEFIDYSMKDGSVVYKKTVNIRFSFFNNDSPKKY